MADGSYWRPADPMPTPPAQREIHERTRGRLAELFAGVPPMESFPPRLQKKVRSLRKSTSAVAFAAFMILIPCFGCSSAAPEACSPESLELTTTACEVAIESAPSAAEARAEYVACMTAIHQWRERCQ